MNPSNLFKKAQHAFTTTLLRATMKQTTTSRLSRSCIVLLSLRIPQKYSLPILSAPFSISTGQLSTRAVQLSIRHDQICVGVRATVEVGASALPRYNKQSANDAQTNQSFSKMMTRKIALMTRLRPRPLPATLTPARPTEMRVHAVLVQPKIPPPS
jgi:hypothetical protein